MTTMTDKILLIEDEINLKETLSYNLEKQGYLVDSTTDGLSAIELVKKIHPDLIILDIMLPGIDGFEVCRIIRRDFSTPILMLTARDDEVDRVVGLEVGADDYMVKPFSMRELMARVKAMLRRVKFFKQEYGATIVSKPPSSQVLSYGNLDLDLGRREVRIGKQPLQFKPKEYELLLFFAQHLGQVLSRELILEKVWGWDYIGDSRTVDVHVRWLREKLEADPGNPQRIVTVRGAGYRFEG